MALSLGLGSIACTEVYEEDQTSSAKLTSPPGQGWLDVAPGVWQRELADGTIETQAVGTAGLQWVMPHLDEAGAMLEQAYRQDPTQERWEQLIGHEQMMDEARRTLAEPAKVPQDHERIAKSGCDVSFGQHANAYALSPGVKATANSYYQNTCGYTGSVYTYTHARIGTDQQTTSCGWRYGANTSCSSTSSRSGSGSDCYSKGIAKVRDQAGQYHTSIRENSSCGSSGGGGGICDIDPASCNCGPGTPNQCP